MGYPNYVVTGDYNIDAGHTLLHGIVASCPVPPARLLLFSDGQFTARNVHTGTKEVIDHVVSSGALELVAIVPGAVEDLMPQGVGDSVGWNVGVWPSDHAMVIAKVQL